ncbi:MAG: phosphatidylinositol-specific phospholipase C domain-containing protein [Clostridiales bacterium]|nr:phosphatidylinositol-specific phospholipase C domain-containing protein [Clostridiales bacterium]
MKKRDFFGGMAMKKRRVLKIVLSVILCALTLFSVLPIRFSKANYENWMAELNDAREIGALSIPGTHDSGALYSIADIYGKCQTLPIKEQLIAGVRFFDIRLRLVNDELFVYHSFVDQKTKFQGVLDDMVSFLKRNPSEFLIVSFKEEMEPIGSLKAFSDALEEMLLRYPDFVCMDRALPQTVGEARGKIHILARYKNASLGVPCDHGWRDDTTFVLNNMLIQDNYEVESADEKIGDIENALEKASGNQYALVVNFSSCYLSSHFPPGYAAYPAHEINAYLMDKMKFGGGASGILACDFMTSDLAGAIIGRNFK